MGGKWKPVYKSEGQKKVGDKYSFNRALTNTDALAEDNDSNVVKIKMFQVNSKGAHKLVAEGEKTLGELRAGDRGNWAVCGKYILIDAGLVL